MKIKLLLVITSILLTSCANSTYVKMLDTIEPTEEKSLVLVSVTATKIGKRDLSGDIFFRNFQTGEKSSFKLHGSPENFSTDDTLRYGFVQLHALKPGIYQLYDYMFTRETLGKFTIYRPKKNFSKIFVVKPNELVYLGEMFFSSKVGQTTDIFGLTSYLMPRVKTLAKQVLKVAQNII